MFKYQGSRNLSPHLANNVNSLYNGIVTDASVIPRHLGTADERAKLMPDLSRKYFTVLLVLQNFGTIFN